MRVGAPPARRLLLASGDSGWAEGWVMRRLGPGDLADVLWLAERAPRGVPATPPARVARHLGREHRLLVVNAHQGFHPDAFAAALGTLRGGGDCVVLAPPLDAWAAYADPDQARFASYPLVVSDMHGHFLGRLTRLWRVDPAVTIVTPGSAVALHVAAPAPAGFRLSAEQEAAVAAIERVALGHARRPLVLTADRGRGKSTALGVAAARLLTHRLEEVTVVAPHRAAVETLFRHALASADLADAGVEDVRIGRGVLRFRVAADFVRDDSGAPGLILVDEAAAIPVALLGRMLEHHNRLVFCSTVHGYEGSGRGFEIRFGTVLQEHMPHWRRLELREPVRWSATDPLEALLDRSFLLDAELAASVDHGQVGIDRIDAATLAADEALLRAVYGLLVNAHYQTRPSDLRQLLDDPQVHLWVARREARVCGVLMAVAEGAFDAAMADQVVAGSRRPRGHLLAQSLAVHAGLDDALAQRLLRVQRIAVHPGLQRRGIGRALLRSAAAWAARQHFDALGCAYGADVPLLLFWLVCDFRPVRLGIRVDPASAAHSLFMLRGLSAQGERLAALGHRQFQAQLPWALAGSLSAVDSRLATRLLSGRDCADLRLSDSDRRDLGRVAAGSRQAATADAPIWRLLVQLASAAAQPSVESLAPLVAWRLQHHPVDRVCRAFSIDGRRELEARLRAAISGPTMTTPRSSG